MALFGKTAAQWRSEKEIKGKIPNIRDFASAEELVVLINLEDTNADLMALSQNTYVYMETVEETEDKGT